MRMGIWTGEGDKTSLTTPIMMRITHKVDVCDSVELKPWSS